MFIFRNLQIIKIFYTWDGSVSFHNLQWLVVVLLKSRKHLEVTKTICLATSNIEKVISPPHDKFIFMFEEFKSFIDNVQLSNVSLCRNSQYHDIKSDKSVFSYKFKFISLKDIPEYQYNDLSSCTGVHFYSQIQKVLFIKTWMMTPSN